VKRKGNPEPPPLNPWDRQPDEPPMWFDRFSTYLDIGPNRTVTAAYNIDREKQGKLPEKQADQTWYMQSHIWQWNERAGAYDAHWRATELAMMEARREEGIRRRLRMMDKLEEKVMVALAMMQPEAWEPHHLVAAMKLIVQETRIDLKQDPRFQDPKTAEQEEARVLPPSLLEFVSDLFQMSPEEITNEYLRTRARQLALPPGSILGSLEGRPGESEEGR
jgi:hypothetical protein